MGAYTHLKHTDAVLIHSWRRLGENSFTLDLRWPAAPHGESYDPRILAQTIRQSGLTVAHAEYEVPLEHHTLLNFLGLTVSPDFRVSDTEPSALVVDITVSPGKSGRRAAHTMHMEIRTSPGGEPVARADTEFAWISPAAYRRVRGDHLTAGWGDWPLPAPVDAALVGRSRAADVVLAPTAVPNRWLLRNDVSNVLLFDHPVDHVPGLALWEAADQAAQALLAPIASRPVSITITYLRYVEFGEPCLIEARPVGPVGPVGPGEFAVRVTGSQADALAFTADIRTVTGPMR
ncbi:ScbA/BarX family gamma-butyrolactone biosynthesis protein [Streptomyces caniscabiei]|uniref:ScbA/BarX family gamma-butyrolactone biosynthesis protein n=1 Tax=Streptomyces caniscabiei TaxID=2746961 RepID=UPI000B05CC01|nr:ScbA/BarX family gamma-butyrolactone biosynthesis protein [Streptomyces caniscabiei]